MKGKNLNTKHVEDDEEDISLNYGCLSGVMHAFDYHQWNYLRRISPKKLKGGRSSDGNLHTTLLQNQDLEQLFGGSERQGLGPTYSPSASKGTLKSRIKVFSKLRKCKKQDSGLSPGQQLQRTYSLHRLEPSDRRLDEIWKNKKSEIIFLPGTLDSANKSPRIDQLNKEANICESTEGGELFQEIKENGDDGEMFLSMLPNFSRNKRFTKSGSFPSADMSRKMNFSPSKLQNKMNEIWVSSEGGLPSRNSVQKHKKHFRAKSWNFTSGSEEIPIDKKLLEHFQSLKSELKNEGRIEKAINHPTETQQIIHCESPDKNEESTVILDEHPRDRDEEHSKCCIELDENSDLRRDFIHRKSYSLNDSLDRYSRILEFTSRPDIKLPSSKSLKLRNKYDHPSTTNVPFRRINSLSLLDFYYPIEKDEQGNEQLASLPLETVPENSTFVEDADAEDIQNETMERMVNTGSLVEESDLKETIDSSMMIRTEKDADFSESTAGFIPTPIEDSNTETLEVAETSSEWKAYSSMNLEPRVGNNTNIEEDPDLIYVRGLLSRSSLFKYITDDIWLSADHPFMNDDFFEEMEADWHEELESQKEDIYGHYTYYHQILFDIVNEVILHLHDRTSLYYPKTLSSTCRIHSMPIGRRICEEIIATTSSFLSRKPNENQTVDDIVYEDVVKDDGWMSLHSESECVALEVQDMIADELLEELLFAELVELQ